jgi:hypothetical protein
MIPKRRRHHHGMAFLLVIEYGMLFGGAAGKLCYTKAWEEGKVLLSSPQQMCCRPNQMILLEIENKIMQLFPSFSTNLSSAFLHLKSAAYVLRISSRSWVSWPRWTKPTRGHHESIHHHCALEVCGYGMLVRRVLFAAYANVKSI